MSEKTDEKVKSGPSRVGKIVAVVSILLCATLVVAPIPAWIGIIAVIIWLFFACPAVMRADELEFWDPGGVDLVTGFIGILWWMALARLMGTTYDRDPWLLGMILAVLTAITIGKIARHWLNLSVMLLGFVLGLAISGLNWWAQLTGGPLATPAVPDSIVSWDLIAFSIMVALIALSIATMATCGYCCDRKKKIR